MTSDEFVHTEEQQLLRETVRDLCKRAWPSDGGVPRYEQAGAGAALWATLGQELGVLGLTAPAELGGAGAGAVELAVLAEELGRVLAPVPLLGTTVAAATLTHSGTADAAELLGPVLTGDRVAAVVATDDAGTWLPDTPTVTARHDAGGWRVDGSAAYVLDGTAAADLLVVAATDDGPLLVAVDADGPGVSRAAVDALDLTRDLADVTFDGATGRAIGQSGQALDAVRSATDIATIVLSAEQLGGSQTMLDRTVEHARTHVQFGRPIGSFQAVRHRCADMLVAVEHARSAVLHAAWAVDAGIDDVPLATSLAHVVSSDAHIAVAGGALQLHGGIGFTWEHPTHLYLKRAWGNAALLGGRAYHRARLTPLLQPPTA
jgi:alkylation response protein AidB-like acyl-CoA dehydrogenase